MIQTIRSCEHEEEKEVINGLREIEEDVMSHTIKMCRCAACDRITTVIHDILCVQ